MRNLRKVLIFGMIICFVAVALSAVGCSSLAKKATEKAIEKETGVDIDTDEDKKVDTSDMPDELIYPDAKAKSRTKMTTAQGESVQVVLETSDTLDDVEDFYDDEPGSEGGWTQQMKMEEEGVVYTFSLDKSWASVNAADKDGKIEIRVQYVKSIKE